MTMEELGLVVTAFEAIANSRTSTYVTFSADEHHPLSPAPLFIGARLMALHTLPARDIQQIQVPSATNRELLETSGITVPDPAAIRALRNVVPSNLKVGDVIICGRAGAPKYVR